jgi:Type VI secretion system/phage-baseplate injector OB domain
MSNIFDTVTTFDAGGSAFGTGSAGTLDASGKPNTRRFYGKYRGKVADNIDPLFLGRILPVVPAVSPEPLTWAMPCVPYAGQEVGFYAIPPIDANVWVEFEAGDPNLPIWTGCFWEEGQVPLETPPPGTFIFKTEFTTLIVRDEPEVGGLSLEITPPAVNTPISINLDSEGMQVLTEAIFSLTSQETNMTSEIFSLESGEANISGESLTIESGETNIAGESLTIESGETNIAGESLTIESAVTNIASDVVGIESAETNIASASLDIEAAETNIASAALTIEGVTEVTGDLLLDGQQVLAI